MAKALVVMLLLSAHAFGQPSISVRLGAAYPWSQSALTDVVFLREDYQKVGFTGGVTARHSLTGSLEVSASIEHDLYPFNKLHPFGALPAQSTEHGGRMVASSGGPAQVTRFGIDVRAISRWDSVKPRIYFLLGGGYTLERYGHVSSTWAYPGGSVSEWDFESDSQNYWAAWFAVGTVWRVSRYFDIEPSFACRYRLEDLAVVHRGSYALLALQLAYNINR